MADEKVRLIQARNKKRATFKRQGLSRKKKLEDTWRRPRGLQSKQRRQYRGKGRHPKMGFGGPVAVRGFHPSGYEEVLVYNVADIEGVNSETHAIRIAGTVGNRKRAVIQDKAIEYGLKVLNAKNLTAPVEEEEPEEEPEEVTDDE